MLIRTLTTVALAAMCAAGVGPHVAAQSADQPVDVDSNSSGEGASVDVTAADRGHSGGLTGGGGGTTAAAARVAGDRMCSYQGEPIDCADASGTWSQDQQCWVQRMSPQPPAEDPIWNGHTGGVVYWCQDPVNAADGVMGGGHMFWAPAAGTAGAPVRVDPVALAEEAIERMNLVGARVGATPLGGGQGIVGVQTWLWVSNDRPQTMGPVTKTASAGSVTVTATAEVTQVVWDMGNGDDVHCRNAGTEWREGVPGSNGNSPTCGYTYLRDSGDQPGGAYTIRPTTYWRVDWSGAGQAGVITFTLTGGSLAMPIVELQTLRIN